LPGRAKLIECLGIGLWLGLGYLSKASAFFLLVGFLLWSLTRAGLRRSRWIGLIGFVAVTSPLLIRHLLAFVNPLYSFNNRFLFADSFEQGVGGKIPGLAEAAREYWRTHSTASVGSRALNGVVWEAFILLRSLGPATLHDRRPLAGFVVLLLAALGAIGADRGVVLDAIAWLVPFYLFFAWYVPIAAGDRFLAPIVPIILLFAARGIVLLFQSVTAAKPDRLERRILFAAVLWTVAVTMLSFWLLHPTCWRCLS